MPARLKNDAACGGRCVRSGLEHGLAVDLERDAVVVHAVEEPFPALVLLDEEPSGEFAHRLLSKSPVDVVDYLESVQHAAFGVEGISPCVRVCSLPYQVAHEAHGRARAHAERLRVEWLVVCRTFARRLAEVPAYRHLLCGPLGRVGSCAAAKVLRHELELVPALRKVERSPSISVPRGVSAHLGIVHPECELVVVGAAERVAAGVLHVEVALEAERRVKGCRGERGERGDVGEPAGRAAFGRGEFVLRGRRSAAGRGAEYVHAGDVLFVWNVERHRHVRGESEAAREAGDVLEHVHAFVLDLPAAVHAALHVDIGRELAAALERDVAVALDCRAEVALLAVKVDHEHVRLNALRTLEPAPRLERHVQVLVAHAPTGSFVIGRMSVAHSAAAKPRGRANRDCTLRVESELAEIERAAVHHEEFAADGVRDGHAVAVVPSVADVESSWG